MMVNHKILENESYMALHTKNIYHLFIVIWPVTIVPLTDAAMKTLSDCTILEQDGGREDFL